MNINTEEHLGLLRIALRGIVLHPSARREYRDDLLQEGWFGLEYAARTYDPDRGFQFSTWAVFCIRSYMLKAIINRGIMDTVRIPAYAKGARNQLILMLSQLMKDRLDAGQTSISVSEAAKLLDVTEDEIRQLDLPVSDFQIDMGRVDQIQQGKPEGNDIYSEVADKLVTGSEQERIVSAASIMEELKEMADADGDVMSFYLYIFGDQNFQDIAPTLNVSTEWARRKAYRGAQKVRKVMEQRFVETFGRFPDLENDLKVKEKE